MTTRVLIRATARRVVSIKTLLRLGTLPSSQRRRTRWGRGEDFLFAQAEAPAQNLGLKQPVSILLFHTELKKSTSLPPILADWRDQIERRREKTFFSENEFSCFYVVHSEIRKER